MSLLVNEIFQSIQGESLYSGLPCIFIRLTGCNLRCSFCDTEYAWSEGDRLGIDEILAIVNDFKGNLVELTGGEPLVQPETPLLIQRLIEKGYTVLIETNGSLDISVLPEGCIRIMDIKCPSSGESEKNDYTNINTLTPGDQIKFVIRDRDDYVFAVNILGEHKPNMPTANILFSPQADTLPPHQLAEWIVSDGLGVRLHLQLHKVIWPDIERGV